MAKIKEPIIEPMEEVIGVLEEVIGVLEVTEKEDLLEIVRLLNKYGMTRLGQVEVRLSQI